MRNPPETLVDLSSLTRVQVETLKIQRAVRKSEINVTNALKVRKNSGISKGTHYRILSQAKKNVQRSLLTVAIAVQLGLVRAEDVQKLLGTVAMIPVEVDQEKLPDILAVVTALTERIVMV